MPDPTPPPEAGAPDQDAAALPEPPPEKPPRPEGRGRLRRRRRELLDRRQEVVYHLGGLAFELYRRDLLTDPVMRLRAEEVAEIDRQVREIDERLEALAVKPARARRAPPAAGECPACGAVAVAGARFCWSCGIALAQDADGAAADANGDDPSDRPTGRVDAGDEPTSVLPREGGEDS